MTQALDREIRPEFGMIFDADNHYWESSDAFTRHRSATFKDRGLRLQEKDGKQAYFIGDREHPILPGPGDQHGRPVPGALFDYFAPRIKSFLMRSNTPPAAAGGRPGNGMGGVGGVGR